MTYGPLKLSCVLTKLCAKMPNELWTIWTCFFCSIYFPPGLDTIKHYISIEASIVQNNCLNLSNRDKNGYVKNFTSFAENVYTEEFTAIHRKVIPWYFTNICVTYSFLITLLHIHVIYLGSGFL